MPPETMALLTEYDWPGNVRELKNVIDRGLSLMGQKRVLDAVAARPRGCVGHAGERRQHTAGSRWATKASARPRSG